MGGMRESSSPSAPPTPAPIDDDAWLTDEQGAALLGIQPRTFVEWRKLRGIPYVLIGSKVALVRRGDLTAWMAKQRRVRITTPSHDVPA